MRRAGRYGMAGGLMVLLLLLLLVSALVYWQDPPYWQRWWVSSIPPRADAMALGPIWRWEAREDAVFPLPAAGPGGTTIPAAALREAEAWAAELGSTALVVVHWGVVQTNWCPPGRDPATPQMTGELHHAVVALLTGAALAAGHLQSLDEPIGSHLPEWAGEPRGEIRLRQLLAMRSGLALYPPTMNPFAGRAARRLLYSSDRTAVLLAAPLAGPPGTTFEFNDVNAALLGLILQRATGRAYADWLTARLWGPMGGEAAELWLDRTGPGALAATACCLRATAMDWARLGLLIKDRGSLGGRPVIPPAWIDAMTRPSAGNPAFGLLVWLGAGLPADAGDLGPDEFRQAEPFLSDDVLLLAGRAGQRIYISRRHDLVVVRLGDGQSPLPSAWDNTRLVNLLLRALETTTPRELPPGAPDSDATDQGD